jgi:hypothetical protein
MLSKRNTTVMIVNEALWQSQRDEAYPYEQSVTQAQNMPRAMQ